MDPKSPNSAHDSFTLAQTINLDSLKSIASNRNAVLMLAGQWASYLGDQFSIIAALPVIYDLTNGNTLAVAMMPIFLALPRAIFGLIGGVFVDRLDRKTLMWAGEIGRGLLIGTWVFASTDADYLWVFYVVALLHGLIGTLFYPARAAIFPLIMNKSELAIGNALLNAGIVFALIFGSLMAGVTVEVIGSQWAFAIDALTFIVSGLLILMMKVPRHATAPTALSGDKVRAELREGLHYVWYTPSVRYIMGLSLAVAFGLGGGIILMMDYLEAQLNVGTAQFGLVISVMGIGFVVGSLIIRRLSHRLSTNQLVAMAMTLDGLALSFFVFDPALFFVLILAAVVGFSVVISRAVLSTLTQVIPPDSLQGRIQGLFDLLFQAPLVLSIGLAGIALTIFSSGVVFLGYGMMLILSAFVALWTLRGIDEIIYADN